MSFSIKRYLLINLLLAITIISILSTFGNYFTDQRTINQHMDHLLSQSAFNIRALLNQKNFNYKQTQNVIKETFDNNYAYQNKYQFVVLDKHGNILLNTPGSPKLSLNKIKKGFHNITIDNNLWRTFALVDKHGHSIITAEELYLRNKLNHNFALNDLYVVLLSYPFLGLLIWYIVAHGLYPIKKATHELTRRATNYLEPMDLTTAPIEIKPLLLELNKLLSRVKEGINREKSFSGNAAHELRTPLAALKTQAQVALIANNEQERNSALQNLIACADRSTHIVQQLLTLSRLVPESISQETKQLNLTKIITDVIADLVPFALEKNIEIEYIGPQEPIYIKGIMTILGILARNLIDNAIRYTPESGAIQVNLTEKSHSVELSVCDNGPGIPKELRSHVFERFYRILGSKSPGSGLGLAIVQQIANLHQAQVILDDNSQGQGLIVKVIFSHPKKDR